MRPRIIAKETTCCMRSKLARIALLATFLVGCVSHLVRLGPGTYMASKQDYLFGTTEGMVADAVENANTFCAKQGKVAMVTERRSIWAEGHGRAEIIFKCADAYQPRVQYRFVPIQ